MKSAQLSHVSIWNVMPSRLLAIVLRTSIMLLISLSCACNSHNGGGTNGSGIIDTRMAGTVVTEEGELFEGNLSIETRVDSVEVLVSSGNYEQVVGLPETQDGEIVYTFSSANGLNSSTEICLLKSNLIVSPSDNFLKASSTLGCLNRADTKLRLPDSCQKFFKTSS